MMSFTAPSGLGEGRSVPFAFIPVRWLPSFARIETALVAKTTWKEAMI